MCTHIFSCVKSRSKPVQIPGQGLKKSLSCAILLPANLLIRKVKIMLNNVKTTALERLEWFAEHIPDNCAVISEPDERLSFGELWQLSGKIYAWLKSKGIGAEDVVMYCLPRGLRL